MNTAEALHLSPLELWAFLENSDFQRRRGDTRLDEDHALVSEIGRIGVRDAAPIGHGSKAPKATTSTCIRRGNPCM